MNKLQQFVKEKPALSLVFGFQLFRLVLLPFMGLMPQDAYYYMYGQNLAWSYLDHPPMIGYLLRLFTEIFGQSVFVIKFADFTVTSITFYYFYKLASKFLSKSRRNKAIVLMATTIFISVLSFNSTPDVPLLLFWTLSVLFLHKAIFEQKFWSWIWAGILMGLAFDSKYTALLLPFGLFAFLVFSKNHRNKLLSIGPWLSLIFMIVFTFPIWWWNYQHEFASFLFQSADRTESMSEFAFKPQLILGVLAHQTVLLIPTLFLVFLTFTFKHIKKFFTSWKLPDDKNLFLLAFFIPTFLGFLLISPIYWVKINWLMPAYITGIILASKYFNKKWMNIQIKISIALHLLITLQVVFYLVPIKSDDTWVGWKELGAKVEEISKEDPEAFIFSLDGYKTSAQIRFFTDKDVFAQNVVNIPALQFDYLGDDMSKYKGKNAFYFDSDKRFKNLDKLGNPADLILPYFEEYIELEPIVVNKGTRKERKFWVFYFKNYIPKATE